MYARVSVAILFHKLSKIKYEAKEGELTADMIAGCQSGRMFLLDLLESVVNFLFYLSVEMKHGVPLCTSKKLLVTQLPWSCHF